MKRASFENDNRVEHRTHRIEAAPFMDTLQRSVLVIPHRNPLMVEGAEKIPQHHAATRLGPKRNRIDQEPDEALCIDPLYVAAGSRSPKKDIFAPRMSA